MEKGGQGAPRAKANEVEQEMKPSETAAADDLAPGIWHGQLYSPDHAVQVRSDEPCNKKAAQTEEGMIKPASQTPLDDLSTGIRHGELYSPDYAVRIPPNSDLPFKNSRGTQEQPGEVPSQKEGIEVNKTAEQQRSKTRSDDRPGAGSGQAELYSPDHKSPPFKKSTGTELLQQGESCTEVPGYKPASTGVPKEQPRNLQGGETSVKGTTDPVSISQELAAEWTIETRRSGSPPSGELTAVFAGQHPSPSLVQSAGKSALEATRAAASESMSQMRDRLQDKFAAVPSLPAEVRRTLESAVASNPYESAKDAVQRAKERILGMLPRSISPLHVRQAESMEDVDGETLGNSEAASSEAGRSRTTVIRNFASAIYHERPTAGFIRSRL